MSRLIPRRPSASLTISVLALIVAVAGGGSAIADTTVSIAKSISGSSIKKGSITSKQIKSGTITSKQIKSNTLTGKQIKESSLGTVPSATSAASAASAQHADAASSVDGAFVKTFNFKGTSASAPVTVLDRGGFRVVASCDGTNKPLLKVTNTSGATGEFIRNTINQSGAAATNTQYFYTAGSTEDAIDVTHGTATFSGASQSGGTLSGQIFFDNGSSYGGEFPGCTVAGSLVSN